MPVPLLLLLLASPSGDAHAARALAPEFLLESSRGERVSLWAPRPGRRGTVVAFLAETCDASRRFAPQLAALAEEYGSEGFEFLFVDASADCDAASAARFEKACGLRAPLLLDPLNAVAPRFGIERAAAVVVLDSELRVAYRGAIDDRLEDGIAREEWLVEAIEALLADEEVATAATEPPGAKLAGRSRPVTFHGEVAPILHTHCADCHRPGQVGPMELLDFDDAAGWAPMIAEVAGNGRMPPWHADPRYGRYVNERRLTDTEKGLLERWAAGGAPEGDAKQRRAPPSWDDDGWAIGKPDLVIQLPRPMEVPAEGFIQYRYELIDPQLERDLWIQACEIRPTARDATHHILAFYIPPGQTPMSALRGLNDGTIVGSGYFAAQVPGCRPNVYPPGTGKKIEKGAKFLLQLHYTPNGKATVDQTMVGFKLCAEPPAREVKTRGVYTFDLRIPPRDPHYVTVARWTFKKPAQLLAMFPHMHTRGAAFKFEKAGGAGADETRSVICDVPKYDFNWQNFYLLEEPVRFAAGETIVCTAVYDNSTDNKFNPNPDAMVFWGDQTFHEMMIGYIDYLEEE